MSSERRDSSEIEITPEMIEAGRDAMLDFYEDELIEASDGVLIQIFQNMSRAHVATHVPFRSRS